MAYQFVNENVGQAKITDNYNTILSLKGVSTNTDDTNTADMFMTAITTLLDVVGWTIADAKRIVTQDVEETT